MNPDQAKEINRLYPLGASVDIPDRRDYDLAGFVPDIAPDYGSKRWHYEGQEALNQGREGACVMFGTANALNCLPRRRRITGNRAMSAYRHLTENDVIPGDWQSGQSGSYPRDGAAYWRERGLFDSYAFTRDMDAIVRWLLTSGPVCMSSDWLVSMDSPRADDDFYVRVDYGRGVRGRHLYCIAGIEWPEEGERFFVILNSWGPDYGYEGRVRLSEAGMRELLRRNINNQALTFVESRR